MDTSENKSVENIQCSSAITLAKDAGELSALNMASISDHYLEGNCLSISYQYSGCTEGKPMLIWNGITTRSIPPQANLQLYVADAGLCDMLLEGSASFDLSTMKISSKEVMIFLNGDRETRLLYKK